MLRLILIRHAKSSWGQPGLDDFGRPLAPRGRHAAPWIGATLREEGWLPDRVLCSPAARTRETLALARIYDSMARDFVPIIREQGGSARTLALIGHNSAMETTALLLAEDAADFGGYPTGAIAVMDFAIDEWSGLEEGSGRIVAFRRPPKE